MARHNEPHRFIKKGADERLLHEIGNIENGQAPEMLTAIYNTYKDNPKIKWKSEALTVIMDHLSKQSPI